MSMKRRRKKKIKTRSKKHLAQYGIPFLFFGIVLGMIWMYFLSPNIYMQNKATFHHQASQECQIKINETSSNSIVFNEGFDDLKNSQAKVNLVYGISDHPHYLYDLKQIASWKNGSRSLEAIQDDLKYEYGYDPEDSQIFFSVFPNTRIFNVHPTNLLSNGIYAPEIDSKELEENGLSLKEEFNLEVKSHAILTNLYYSLNFSFHYIERHYVSLFLPILPYLDFEEMSLNWQEISNFGDILNQTLDQLVMDESSIFLRGETLEWKLKEVCLNYEDFPDSSEEYSLHKVIFEINGEEKTLTSSNYLKLIN